LGATGAINVDVDVKAAATQATVSTTGIPASTTPVNSSGTISFSAAAPDAEATGSVTFADSYTIGAEATGAITFGNATTPDGESAGTLELGSGVLLDIAAVDGGAADGTIGNDTTINIVTQAPGGTRAASFDANSNVLTLTINENDTSADIAGDAAFTGNADFTFATNVGTGATVAAGDAGPYTAPTGPGSPGYTITTAGTDATDVATGFTLSATNGGAADGLTGDDVVINYSSGATTAASYDANANELNITVADGASINDIFNAINADVGSTFTASNLNNGGYTYSTADNGTDPAGTISGGSNPNLPGSFDIEAVNGQAADGTAGNGATLNLTSGATTAAVYDAGTNTINITVADGATVDDIASAINADGNFLTRNVSNGTSILAATDLGANDPSLALGSDVSANDVITVTADDPSATFDGTTITVNADNSLAAGTASASLDTSGNIIVNISDVGDVTLGTIATAIGELDGFSAAVTATDGDGSINPADIAAATTTDFAGGVFGGGLNADLVVQVRGEIGSEVFQFEKGATLDSIIQSINLVSDATGINAEDDGGNLKLTSTNYGSDALIDIEVISEGAGGTFKSGLSSTTATGADINATVNGITADGDGNSFSINTSTLDINLTVNDGSADDFSFTISGGGAKFQLGPDVTTTQQARLGIGSVSTGQLGGPAGRLYELGSGQSKSLTNDVGGAARVIDDVISKVTGLRGRLGAFQATTLNSNLVSLKETQANLLEAESSIRDADFAQESANLTRAQILTQSGTNVLSLANQNPQNVLSLLR
jgi:flagellin